MKPRIAVVDYEMGNLHSVSKALEACGAHVEVTHSSLRIAQSQGVVLPGVGAFGEAVKRLQSLKLMRPIQKALETSRPFLGICLGLQLLFERSEESAGAKGFGYFRGVVRRFRMPSASLLKVPHMGWNTISKGPAGRSPVLHKIPKNAFFYFVHSYYPAPKTEEIVATRSRYGRPFCSSVAQGTLFASQFHPEKSGAQGLALLKNFVREVARCS